MALNKMPCEVLNQTCVGRYMSCLRAVQSIGQSYPSTQAVQFACAERDAKIEQLRAEVEQLKGEQGLPYSYRITNQHDYIYLTTPVLIT